MKKSILIEEFEKNDSTNLVSKITKKKKKEGLNTCRKFTLRNHSGNWTHLGKKRISVKFYDLNNTIGKPEVTIKTSSGNIYEMEFLELCDLRDILNHIHDFGDNLFTETKVIKK